MNALSGTASRPHQVICPFCESDVLVLLGPGFARCRSCGLPLLGSTLETLQNILELPAASGLHPCECGHPAMRELPDGVFHCPACGSEVLPVEDTDAPRQVVDGRLHCVPSDVPSPFDPTQRTSG